MRRIIALSIFILLTGCATAPRQPSNYVIPEYINQRPMLAIYGQLHSCLEMPYDPSKPKLSISASRSINARADGDGRVTLTEGVFRYDDKILTFIIAHELAHIKLSHYTKKAVLSYGLTGLMTVVGAFVPGAGSLNYLFNPAAVNNLSKSQEYDADSLAWDACQRCFGFTNNDKERILATMGLDAGGGGGFFDTHPAWKDRVDNLNQ